VLWRPGLRRRGTYLYRSRRSGRARAFADCGAGQGGAKLDGYRAIGVKGRETILYSRNGKNFNKRFPQIAEALRTENSFNPGPGRAEVTKLAPLVSGAQIRCEYFSTAFFTAIYFGVRLSRVVYVGTVLTIMSNQMQVLT